MINEVQQLCKDLLAGKKVGGILGIKEENGHWAPYLFTREAELTALVIARKCLLFNTCRVGKEDILSIIQRRYPDLKIGIVAKGCDERALLELAKRGQLKLESVEIIGVACDRKQAAECRCPRPSPLHLKFGEKVEGIAREKELDNLLKKSLAERMAFWQYQFSKCIKCYGCRNACPMCFCKDCVMEQEWFAKTGWVPPDFPLFHFVQFFHHADRCIECGECEDACPMEIPLRLIKKFLRERVQELFHYEPGVDVGQESPLDAISEQLTTKEASHGV